MRKASPDDSIRDRKLSLMNPLDQTQSTLPSIRIGDQRIGRDHPTYVVAEIGINHNGDPGIARKLIDTAADARVNAVKFQKRHLPSLYPRDVLEETTRYEQNFQYMIPILKEVELREDDLADLKAYAGDKGLEFLCTPFDRVSADFLDDLGTRAFKIASADLNNTDLLEHVAAKKKPIILSTGMSYWDEIKAAVGLLKGSGTPFALLHCRSVYPVWPREVNLQMINRLESFGVPVGYSGHDIGITIPLVAASMGASIIEKHITLDRHMRGPDHKISLEGFELKRLVRDIRVADQAMGRQKRFLLRGEILNRELFGKSLKAAVDISKGTPITREMIRIQGPGKGLPPHRLRDLVGREALRDLSEGDLFLEEDLERRTHAGVLRLFQEPLGPDLALWRHGRDAGPGAPVDRVPPDREGHSARSRDRSVLRAGAGGPCPGVHGRSVAGPLRRGPGDPGRLAGPGARHDRADHPSRPPFQRPAQGDRPSRCHEPEPEAGQGCPEKHPAPLPGGH